MLFANCPRLDVLACSYLLLAQNQQQDIFQFEVYSHFIYAHKTIKESSFWLRVLDRLANPRAPFSEFFLRRFLAGLDRMAAPYLKKPMNHNSCIEPIRRLVAAHDQWLMSVSGSYGGWTMDGAPVIVVTETPFDSEYYSIASDDKQIAVISIPKWQKHFAPPSVLEFVLSKAQRYALWFLAETGSHYATRGCLCDFTADVRHARVGVALGYLCDACEAEVLRRLQPADVEKLKQFLSHHWIGRPEEPGTVAGSIKRIFSYDLARTKGISPGFRDKLIEVFKSEAVNVIVRILFAVGAFLLVFLFGFQAGKDIHEERHPPPAPQFRNLDIHAQPRYGPG